MDKNVAADLQEVSEKFIIAISQIPDERINEIPPIEGWTIGQVGEHILKSAGFVAIAIEAPPKDTSRDPSEKVQPLTDIFLNFNIKMKGPEMIDPSDAKKNKDALIQSLSDVFKKVHDFAASADLTKTCAGADMPGMGEMTRLEWISFLNVHTRRHIHQLENIRLSLH